MARLAVICVGSLGVGLGLLAGYFTGRLDDITMRIADVQLAFPFILLAITIAGVLGPRPRIVIFILAVGGWVLTPDSPAAKR